METCAQIPKESNETKALIYGKEITNLKKCTTKNIPRKILAQISCPFLENKNQCKYFKRGTCWYNHKSVPQNALPELYRPPSAPSFDAMWSNLTCPDNLLPLLEPEANTHFWSVPLNEPPLMDLDLSSQPSYDFDHSCFLWPQATA
jgi:hypothetical protein